MTVIIKTGTKPIIKPRRKPGFAAKQEQYQQWLKQHGATGKRENTFTPLKTVPNVLRRPTLRDIPSVEVKGGSTLVKPVPKRT